MYIYLVFSGWTVVTVMTVLYRARRAAERDSQPQDHLLDHLLEHLLDHLLDHVSVWCVTDTATANTNPIQFYPIQSNPIAAQSHLLLQLQVYSIRF